MIFGRGMALAALAAASMSIPVAGPGIGKSALAVQPQSPRIARPVLSRDQRKKRRRAMAHPVGKPGRNKKLARRLRRKAALGRNGAF